MLVCFCCLSFFRWERAVGPASISAFALTRPAGRANHAWPATAFDVPVHCRVTAADAPPPAPEPRPAPETPSDEHGRRRGAPRSPCVQDPRPGSRPDPRSTLARPAWRSATAAVSGSTAETVGSVAVPSRRGGAAVLFGEFRRRRRGHGSRRVVAVCKTLGMASNFLWHRVLDQAALLRHRSTSHHWAAFENKRLRRRAKAGALHRAYS